MARKAKWTKEQLEQEVKKSKGYRETCKRLGLKGGASWLKNKIKELGIDDSHFVAKPIAGQSTFFKHIGEQLWFLKINDVQKKYNSKTKKFAYFFVCDCLKCGRKNTIKTCGHVIRGLTKTCGCKKNMLYGKKGANNKLWKGCGELSGRYYSSLQKGAKRRGYEFSVTKEYLWNLFLKQNRKCLLSDLPLTFGTVDRGETKTASLDRINPELGYIEGNLCWVHKKLNVMKYLNTTDEFIDLCRKVVKKHGL